MGEIKHYKHKAVDRLAVNFKKHIERSESDELKQPESI